MREVLAFIDRNDEQEADLSERQIEKLAREIFEAQKGPQERWDNVGRRCVGVVVGTSSGISIGERRREHFRILARIVLTGG
jgi:hypothetical protein